MPPIAFSCTMSASSSSSADRVVSGSTSTAKGPPKTFSGLTLISGEIPNNSARNFMRCCTEGCAKTVAKGCQARMCDDHCSTEFTGLKCSLHKGTKAQPASLEEIQSSTSSVQAARTQLSTLPQGRSASSKAPAASPKKGRGGRPPGPKPSRSYGISFSNNLDADWEVAHNTAMGFAQADPSLHTSLAPVYALQETTRVFVYFWHTVRSSGRHHLLSNLHRSPYIELTPPSIRMGSLRM